MWDAGLPRLLWAVGVRFWLLAEAHPRAFEQDLYYCSPPSHDRSVLLRWTFETGLYIRSPDDSAKTQWVAAMGFATIVPTVVCCLLPDQQHGTTRRLPPPFSLDKFYLSRGPNALGTLAGTRRKCCKGCRSDPLRWKLQTEHVDTRHVTSISPSHLSMDCCPTIHGGTGYWRLGFCRLEHSALVGSVRWLLAC